MQTCILLYKYKINSRQILRLLLEKYTKEVIEYFNSDCSVDETVILTEMIKKLFILSIKHRKEFPVHLLSHCKKGQTCLNLQIALSRTLSSHNLNNVQFFNAKVLLAPSFCGDNCFRVIRDLRNCFFYGRQIIAISYLRERNTIAQVSYTWLQLSPQKEGARSTFALKNWTLFIFSQ